MSQPAPKIAPLSAREKMAREIRKQNMDAIIRAIENDLKAEKNSDKKRNIAACLEKAKKKGIYISGDDIIYATNNKAHKVKNDQFKKLYASMDAQSKKLAYHRRGYLEQMMAGTPKPTQPRGPNREQMLQVTTYMNMEPKLDGSGPTTMHQIFAKVRIPARLRTPGLKGDDLRKVEAGARFVVAFDTGSEVQTIERMIWNEISGNGRFYAEDVSPGGVMGATGITEPRTYVQVDIGYFKDSECQHQMGEWREIEAIYSDRGFEHNLSGREIYKDFNFIVPKGNNALIMGTSKPVVIWEYLIRSREINDIALIQEWAAAQVAQAGASGSQGRAA